MRIVILMIYKAENYFQSFIKLESAGGILLFVAAFAAILAANSPFAELYDWFLTLPVSVSVSTFEIAKPLQLWINDGLMALFFFLVGLELKREVLEGELKDPRNIILPGIGAIGGMAAPALLYLIFNYEDPYARHGWAIPAATDIAFALGVLTLLGSRVPVALKVFLTSLAIIDDIGAIIVIALFYTSKISLTALVTALCCIPFLYYLNRKNVTAKGLYFFFGLIMWAATLKSGVHATLAGVVLAMFIPLRDNSNPRHSPLKRLEHDFHSIVAYFVLPVFAFANAGINFTGMTSDQIFHPVPVGVAVGLFLGKPLGIFGLCYLTIKAGFKLPEGMTEKTLFATSLICGIGFTMSLFIGSLAFGDAGSHIEFDERIGILFGSFISGLVGFVLLSRWLPKTAKQVKPNLP
jgi:NhaA family Na+:H+ antiporter